MLLYYITDRHAFPGSETEKRQRLLAKVAEAAQAGVDFIQLREKDLTARELEYLAREAVDLVRQHSPRIPRGVPHPSPTGETTIRQHEPRTRLLINSRLDIAITSVADGVHLTSTDISASQARNIRAEAQRGSREGTASSVGELPALKRPAFVIAVSGHTVDEIRSAEANGADFAVLAPVFEKSVATANSRHTIIQRTTEEGLSLLRAACPRVGSSGIPVLALGGVTVENARECIAAGAAGIAGIRLFQDNNLTEVVRLLRETT